MKYMLTVVINIFFISFFIACGNNNEKNMTQWEKIKSDTILEYNSAEYDKPYRQPLSTTGWEDGIYISRDGNNLYCIYAPGDLLSWTINSADPTAFDPYRRGPSFGMDLVTNPVSAASWVQADILYSSKSGSTGQFESWVLSDMARHTFSEGAPVAIDASGASIGTFLFTSNDKPPTYDTDIWILTSTALNPSGTGATLSGFAHTTETEDNPHIERISASDLVLMFDSDNYTGGLGSHDIWYSLSTDNASTWSVPQNLSSVNTSEKEHQPHLYNDGTDWWLYFSATHTDGKLGIFRAKQQTSGDWDSWGTSELVIGAGNSAGVGEPTLTSSGDISFVVVYENLHGGEFDRYDADPWFMKTK